MGKAMSEFERLTVEVRADQDQAWAEIRETLLGMPGDARADLVQRCGLSNWADLGKGEREFFRLCALAAITEAALRIEEE